MLKVFPMRNTYRFRFSKVLQWALVNGIMFYFAWMWLGRETQFARNAFIFLFWYTTAITALVAYYSLRHPNNAVVIKLQQKGPTVPLAVDVFYDLAMIVLLVGFGHWIMGIVWMVQMFCNGIIFRDRQNEPSAHTEPAPPYTGEHVRNPGDGQK